MRSPKQDSDAKTAATTAHRPAAGRGREVKADTDAHGTHGSILRLQRSMGNRYVQRLVARAGGAAEAIPPETERSIRSARGGGQPLGGRVKARMESAFGADFGGVRVHTGARPDSLNGTLGARAFTVGRDIFFGRGQFQPGSSAGQELLAHELTHVVQQNGAGTQGNLTMTKPGDDAEREASDAAQTVMANSLDHTAAISEAQSTLPVVTTSPGKVQLAPGDPDRATVQMWVWTYLRASPDEGDFLLEGDRRLRFNDKEDVELVAASGDWLRVKGDAFLVDGTPAGEREAWVKRDRTNLTPAPDAATENGRVAQDLDDFLDEVLIPAVSKWESALRTQGNAYLTAYTNFDEALKAATQQAKARADFWAAVLTAVSAGALGWFGDVATAGKDFTGLLKSPAVRGGLEDAIQSAVGEAIDIKQGGWFTQHISRETHPLRYLNSSLKQLTDLMGELTLKIGSTKSSIRRTRTMVDRAAVMTEIYNWWNGVVAHDTPPAMSTKERAMAKEMERGFWQKYILERLTEGTLYLFWGYGYKYSHPEKAVRDRLYTVGIQRDAGITKWSEWYEPNQYGVPDYEPNPGYGGGETPYFGSDDTQKLAKWARSYKLKTFGT